MASRLHRVAASLVIMLALHNSGLGAQDAATFTIDSATVRASAARTLSDLLAGRVPGLAVTHSTGMSGYAPQLRMRWASGNVGAAEPALYVDGVLVHDDQYWVTPDGNGHRPSFAWDLPVSEILDVQVVRGQAGGIMLEFGAPRGAVLVRTRRPAAGAARVGAFVEGTSARETTAFPANVGAAGTTGGGATTTCALSDRALGQCTFTGDLAWNPLETVSPFRATTGTRAGVDATSAIAIGAVTGAIRAGATFDRTPGVIEPAGGDRLDLALSYQSAPGTRLSLALDARHATQNATFLPAWESILRSGLFGSAEDGPTRGYLNDVAPALASRTPIHTGRTTVAARASWPVNLAVSAEARLSIDRYARRSFVSRLTPDPFGGPSVETSTRNGATIDAWTIGAGVRVGHAILGQRALLRAGAFASSTRFADSSLSRGTGSSLLRVESELETVGISVVERAWFGSASQRSVGAGVRLATIGESNVGETMAHVIDGSWELSAEPFFPRTRWIGQVTLHASHAAGPDVAPALGLASRDVVPIGNLDGAPTRVREADVGARLATWGLELDVRTFDRRTDFLPLAEAAISFVDPRFRVFGDHAVEVRGREFMLTLPSRRLGPASLDVSVAYATARERVALLMRPSFAFGEGNVTPLVVVREGGPVGSIGQRSFTFDDVNGDGIIDETEVAVSPAGEPQSPRGSTRPDRLLAISARASWGRFSLGAVLDGQYGQHRTDGVDEFRCRIGTCRALYDPSTSLEEQARAIALDRLNGFSLNTQDAGFSRLREVWMRVALPSSMFGGRTAAIILAGHQLAVWSSYSALDPEVGVLYGGSYQDSYVGEQPLLPRWSVRLDIGR